MRGGPRLGFVAAPGPWARIRIRIRIKLGPGIGRMDISESAGDMTQDQAAGHRPSDPGIAGVKWKD